MEKDWIKNLKVGDEVILESGGWNHNRHIEKVEKINKTTVRVCGSLYTFDGYERCSGWHRSTIHQLTDESRIEVEIENEGRSLRAKLCKVNWDVIPIEKLRSITKILYEK